MDEFNTLPLDPVPDLQRTVQRMLGRCMLQLQQYERLLKTMVAHSELSGPSERLKVIRDEKVVCAYKKTLGTLVGMLTKRYLYLPDLADEPEHTESSDQIWISFRCLMELPEEHYAEAKAGLKELVDLRNDLVHHFLQRFDLWSVNGCIAAESYLDKSNETIDGHYLTLRDWAKSMDAARQHMVSFMETPAYRDFVINGIGPDDTVQWASSCITNHLREAETKLAQAGWAPFFEAIHWIAKTYPEQTPKRYGCGSWHHVIHASQQFEIRKQSQIDTGATVVWYRSRPRETSKEQE